MLSVTSMKPRVRFQMKEQLLTYEIMDQKKKKPEKGKFTILPLKQAVSLIYEHISEMTKENEQLRDDVLLAGLGNPVAQEKVKAVIRNLLSEYRIEVDESTLIHPMNATESIFAQTCGAGLLEDLYREKDVEEVQVVGREIFLVRNGQPERHHRMFESLEEVRLLQDRLALCGKKPINEKNPVLQSYMWNRSRLVMARENYSDIPIINIRNFIVRDVSLDGLVLLKTINPQMAALLKHLVRYHASIVVGGSTNTGKTTFLFSLAQEIPENERIITLEKEFEIALRDRLKGVRNIVALREVSEIGLTMEEAFKPILVMSPKWVIVGEAKGAEVAQMIQGSLRGHDVMGTLHTKYRDSFISDVVDMVKQDGRQRDDQDLKSSIARAFNILIFLRLLKVNGETRRVVTEITELYTDADRNVYINPLVLWNYEKNDWEFTGNQISSNLVEHMLPYGADLDVFRRLGVYGKERQYARLG